jgi:hypothetical protein
MGSIPIVKQIHGLSPIFQTCPGFDSTFQTSGIDSIHTINIFMGSIPIVNKLMGSIPIWQASHGFDSHF